MGRSIIDPPRADPFVRPDHAPERGHPGRIATLGFRATPATLAIGANALSRIWYPWQRHLPGWSLRFLPSRPGFLGRTLWPDRIIEIYVRPGQGTDEVAFALAHELGHAVDLEHFDPERRARWRRARQLPTDLPWFGASDANDFATPAGDWAESFAAWQIGPAYFQSLLAPAPHAGHHELLRSLALPEGAASPTDRWSGRLAS